MSCVVFHCFLPSIPRQKERDRSPIHSYLLLVLVLATWLQHTAAATHTTITSSHPLRCRITPHDATISNKTTPQSKEAYIPKLLSDEYQPDE